MSRPSRNAVTRANRRRQHQREWTAMQTNGEGLPAFANPIVEKVTLEVHSDTQTYLARYGKTRLGRWKLLRCDPFLNFLRWCGRKDAPIALKNRGLTYQFHAPRSDA